MARKYHRVRPRNTRNPTKKIVYRSGSEGPKHDPYFYEEYFGYNAEGKPVTLHLGLGAWLKIDREKTEYNDLGLDLNTDKGERRSYAILIKWFEKQVGTTIAAVDKYRNSLEPDPMGCLADYE